MGYYNSIPNLNEDIQFTKDVEAIDVTPSNKRSKEEIELGKRIQNFLDSKSIKESTQKTINFTIMGIVAGVIVGMIAHKNSLYCGLIGGILGFGAYKFYEISTKKDGKLVSK